MFGITNAGGGGSSSAWAYIAVTYPAGSTCTATNGTITLTAQGTSGLYVFQIPEPATTPETWTVSCTDGTKTKSATVEISTQYSATNVTLRYSRLPEGYQEVEYLESTQDGGQYIQTGITSFNQTDEIDISFMYFAIPAAGNQNIISIAGTADAQHYMRIPAINNNYNSYIISDSAALVSTPQANTRFDAVINNSSHKVLENDTDLGTLTSYTGDFWYSYQITLFGISNTAGTLSGTGSRCRIYSFVHKNNSTGTVLRNYVPCYRILDNVAGFYDLANAEFIANAGSTAFVVGADV